MTQDANAAFAYHDDPEINAQIAAAALEGAKS
jgi:hypothetical protein